LNAPSADVQQTRDEDDPASYTDEPREHPPNNPDDPKEQEL
jgi:hypothetical protein